MCYCDFLIKFLLLVCIKECKFTKPLLKMKYISLIESIIMTVKKSCLLCGKSPEEGMHISGKKLIKGELMPYQLCRACCLPSDGPTEDGMPSRRKVWEKVESQLIKLKKKTKN